LNEALIAMALESHSGQIWFYLLRAATFMLIAAAIIRKNAVEPEED
jgi:hypothetical protein